MLEDIERQLKKKKTIEEIKTKKEREKRKILILTGTLLGFISISTFLFLNKKMVIAFGSFFVVTSIFFLFFYFKKKLKESLKIKKVEDNFPDFLQLMASNLRAGMTIDRAMLLSSRPEFDPLDKEMINVGKDIATGRSLETALLEMSKRIKSEKIEKTVLLIISGIKSGGNLAILLEETSSNMRERNFVEKRAASSVLMYVIFIFIAASIGAPVLFSLSGILVETLTNILSGLPPVEETSANLPFTLSSIEIPIDFVRYFSLVFIIVINILASLVLGLVSKGEEKQGLRFLIPMLVLSMTIFFGIKFFLARFIAELFI